MGVSTFLRTDLVAADDASLAGELGMRVATRITIAELGSQLRAVLLRLNRLERNWGVGEPLTSAQMSALAGLSKNGPMSAGELAAFEQVQPPSMTKVLLHLEERGLVLRRAHPIDRRQAVLEVAPAGEAMLDSGRRSVNAWLAKRLAKLSADERALIARVIPIIDELTEQQH